MTTAGPPPIMGYPAIAAALTKRLEQSVSERTARRWARYGINGLRPVVLVYPNRRVYMLAAHLEAFAAAYLALLPAGGHAPGKLAA